MGGIFLNNAKPFNFLFRLISKLPIFSFSPAIVFFNKNAGEKEKIVTGDSGFMYFVILDYDKIHKNQCFDFNF